MISNDLKNKTILIVDDTPENIDVLNELLSDYNRKLALNGNKAIKIAQTDPQPDLILLDIMMPGIDGFEVCRLLRKDEKTKNIPIIFLTAMYDKESVVKGFELGAQDFISKPFDPKELLVRVRTQLQLKHQNEMLKNLNSILEEKVALRTSQLKKANKELLALDKAKNNFLHLISHEIRTPLNGILGSASLLNDMHNDDEEMKEFYKLLNLSAERLNRFSITALTITQLQTNNYKIKKSKTNLIELIEKVISKNKESVLKKNLSIKNEYNNTEIILNISPQLCTKAINTIFSNAVKYTPENSSLIVNAYKKEDNYVCEVIDEGPGFDPKLLNHILKPFGSYIEHKDLRIGIDLAATKMIMEAHKGSIYIGKKDGKGAVVRLIFKEEK